jgi:hypothetical protein
MLLREREPSKIRWRLADFYDAALDADMAETSRLAKTIQTWWPAILVALTHDVANARTEGFNRIRACGSSVPGIETWEDHRALYDGKPAPAHGRDRRYAG